MTISKYTLEGKLTLTLTAKKGEGVLEKGLPVTLSGDYEIRRAKETNDNIVGYILVPNKTDGGEATVLTRGHAVKRMITGSAYGAGVLLGLNAAGKVASISTNFLAYFCAEYYSQTLGGLLASENVDQENTDQINSPSNCDCVCNFQTVIAGIWKFINSTDPDVGRNICITIRNDSGSSLDLFEGTITFTIIGTYKGVTQSEQITFISNAANKVVADGRFRFKYGLKPFHTITDITLDNLPDNGLKIGIGVGSSIGLLKQLFTPHESDVLNVIKNGSKENINGKVDIVNNTFKHGAIASNSNLSHTYRTDGGIKASDLGKGIGAGFGIALESSTGSDQTKDVLWI